MMTSFAFFLSRGRSFVREDARRELQPLERYFLMIRQSMILTAVLGLSALFQGNVVRGQSLPKLPLPKKPPVDLRADYLDRLHEQLMPPPGARTTGSLWSSANALGDLSSDYKARNVNDVVVVQVAVQTPAAPHAERR